MAKVVLLVEAVEEGAVAVEFPSFDAASDWERDHEYDLTGRGAVRVVSRREALKLAAGE